MVLRPDWLPALSAFESAARHQNFAHAAEELNLTASAVSHHVRKLEARLGLSLAPLFRRSGVALHNRMIERHLGRQGQYLWISYDFNSDVGTSDLLANPLGPEDPTGVIYSGFSEDGLSFKVEPQPATAGDVRTVRGQKPQRRLGDECPNRK